MKAIDTNVLVRFLVNDDAKQAQAVRELFHQAEKQQGVFFIPLLVVLETLWVLDSAYGIARDEIINVFKDLLLLPILEFENRSAVQNMVSSAHGTNFDLSDLLIAESARLAGCSNILTFDKKAARNDLFQPVGSGT